jgi:hypothetical protein
MKERLCTTQASQLMRASGSRVPCALCRSSSTLKAQSPKRTLEVSCRGVVCDAPESVFSHVAQAVLMEPEPLGQALSGQTPAGQ